MFLDLQRKARGEWAILQFKLARAKPEDKEDLLQSGTSRGRGKASYARGSVKQTTFGPKSYPIAGNVIVEPFSGALEGTPEEREVNFRLVRL